jgi:hypothetical protein
VVTVEGQKADKRQREFLYQGISSRRFKRQFNLADYVQVKGAAFDNGLLQIDLVREVPEAMKPRRIAIEAVPAAPSGSSKARRPSQPTTIKQMPRRRRGILDHYVL